MRMESKLTRRDFLGTVTAAGAWMMVSGSAACGRGSPQEAEGAVGSAVPELRELRRLVMQDALEKSFHNGRLRVENREAMDDFWWVLNQEANFASLAAFEFTDRQGPYGGDTRARDQALGALESVTSQFRPTGTVGGGDRNSAYFALVPITRALVKLKGHVDEAQHRRLVERCARLYADAAKHINRTHDYLNPRALEAVAAFGLHRLTGERGYLDRCNENLDELIKRQYASGAQPYRTDTRAYRPTQNYQYMSANLMLDLGFQLDRQDVVDYVRRIADYALLSTNRRGEAFNASFVGLQKSRSLGSAGRQWALASALGDERYRGLARATYERWAPEALEFGLTEDDHKPSGIQIPTINLNEALYLGVKKVPQAEGFTPPRGLHPLPEMSTVFVHQPALDISMSLIGGGAIAEADCGDVKLFALTPEFTDEPTHRDSGIRDDTRSQWNVPGEHLECTRQGGKTLLRDRVRAGKRLLDVSMTYGDGEMLLEYQTVENQETKPMPSRLLFMLIARPSTAQPRLQIGREVDTRTPAAESEESYSLTSAVGTVRFSAPDGSAMEIVPEESLAQSITAERPPQQAAADVTGKAGRNLDYVKPANEGSLRLAFEGPQVFDRGRYRIRFLPA